MYVCAWVGVYLQKTFRKRLPLHKSNPAQCGSQPRARGCFLQASLWSAPNEEVAQSTNDIHNTYMYIDRSVKVFLPSKNMGSLVYLGSVNRTGCEWSVREGLRGAQQVSDSIKVMFILLNGLNAHSVFGKKSFVTWCVTRRGQELKIPMTTSQKEASSEKWRKTQVNKWEDIINVHEWIKFLKNKTIHFSI